MTESAAGAVERIELTGGWELARAAPDAIRDPSDVEGLNALRWAAASVPGTVATAGADRPDLGDVDAWDWWFRRGFAAPAAGPEAEVSLLLEGLATLAQVWLNGEEILRSESMFAAHRIDIGASLAAENVLTICCRALAPRLQERRRPRARWRTRLVSEPNLRFFRTMLLGRAPGFAPGPAVVGPWRPIALERRLGIVADDVRLRARLDGDDGIVDCRVRLRSLGAAPLPAAIPVTVARDGGARTATLTVTPVAGGGEATGSAVVPNAARWWPHTHGEPALYDVVVGDPAVPLHRARVGFRELSAAADLRADGPHLSINGVPIFVRGAVWTPRHLHGHDGGASTLRPLLERVRAVGMNMLRVPGIAAYESPAFHDLCDELGILVWQDFMFANLDYPEHDGDFMAAVEAEATAVLAQLGGRPSLAVLCGGSEVAQQVAMMGLDPTLAEGPLFGELLPRLVAEARVDAPYVPSTPWGGDLPFRPDRGVANYYGVGAYRRPLEDARRAGVRFAAECLAFANVPDDDALEALHTVGGPVPHDPLWKAGVPRDVGAGWDFDDVRDHYLRLLYELDPSALRSTDPERYLELSRMVSGEVMAEVFGEWRRADSSCDGALVLWLADLVPGAGWGVLDHRGRPKVAYHHLRRALAPLAVWSTDEGLGGIDVHLANDGASPVSGRLRVALYRDRATLVEQATEELTLGAHEYARRNVEALLGHFVDVSWAYRFGPPGQDLVAMTWERREGDAWRPVAQAFRFPAGRPGERDDAARLQLTAALVCGAGGPAVRLAAERFVHGVRIDVPGWVPADDAFGVEPGHAVTIALAPEPATAGADAPAVGMPEAGTLTAVNLRGRLRIVAG